MKPIYDLLEKWKRDAESLTELNLGKKDRLTAYAMLDCLRLCARDLEQALQQCETPTPPVKTDGNWSEL